ncbi:hypothetical protein MLD38_006371 [Melastoma candidum]|uniref:Uncharacterized protein n=1 Tax=Melastoma candidum TaxID=119954 RepID=A0ACB9RRD9_9MYRT|nr:hypothetical protein MLD38_006371 [Melastoma candidum]
MEFAAPFSSDTHPYHRPRPGPPHPVTDRILRAVHHRLLLLHRSDPDFFVLGATGNVYTVTLSASPSCTCPDRTTPCKHILFVLIRVLGVPLDDPCLRRRTLRPCRLRCLLSTPSDVASLASASLRARFHERFFLVRKRGGSNEWGARPDERPGEEEGDGDEPEACPICLEEMGLAGGEGGRAVVCTTCRNKVHEECQLTWKKSLGRRSAICVMCRSRWRKEREPDRYVNLAAYVGEDDSRSRIVPVADEDGASICGD